MKDATFHLIYQLLEFSFLVESLFGFFVGFYHKGEVVMDRAEIAKQYLKSYFLTDFLPLVLAIVVQSFVTTPWATRFFLQTLVCLKYVSLV